MNLDEIYTPPQKLYVGYFRPKNDMERHYAPIERIGKYFETVEDLWADIQDIETCLSDYYEYKIITYRLEKESEEPYVPGQSDGTESN
jgi:hypothetical protein